MESDEQHLLAIEGEFEQLAARKLSYADDDRPVYETPTKRRWYTFTYYFALHVILLVVVLELIRHYATHRSPSPRIHESPASSAISFKILNEHATDHHKYSQYSGPPSSVNERAWASLIKPTFFGATRDEMIAANESVDNATELAEVGGFLASLDVYHEMHCLRRLRWFLYKETYYPNITIAEQEHLQGHLDHCIETIRISLMCTADISLYTFRWEESNTKKPATESNSKRYCVDWSALDDWSRRRAVDLNPRLKRPEWMAVTMDD